jgi:hypothetical protein
MIGYCCFFDDSHDANRMVNDFGECLNVISVVIVSSIYEFLMKSLI